MERQAGHIIRPDHTLRYQWALQRTSGDILDAACGTGYGSAILSVGGLNDVVGVDVDEGAIEEARLRSTLVKWIKGDIADAPWGVDLFDAVICFETIEHTVYDLQALRALRSALKRSGRLFLSVPSEEGNPLVPAKHQGTKYPHLRHYTRDGLERLLGAAGFSLIERWHQADKESAPQRKWNGSARTLIAVCACAD